MPSNFVLCCRIWSRQRYRRVSLILPSSIPSRSSSAVEGYQRCSTPARCRAHIGHIGGSLIDGLLEEVIEFEPFPELEAQIAGAKLPRPFQAHLVQQNAGYLRIILRRLDMRRKQLQLFRLTLFVENLDGLQPACLRRAVQLTQITQRPLSWSVRSSNSFNQRPVGVIFAILDSMVRTQKHSGRIVSRGCWLPQEGRSTLHRRFNRRHCRRRVCYPFQVENILND